MIWLGDEQSGYFAADGWLGAAGLAGAGDAAGAAGASTLVACDGTPLISVQFACVLFWPLTVEH